MSEIEITQADREAAARLYGYPSYEDVRFQSSREQVEGYASHFARHRTQARAEAIEEAARVADVAVPYVVGEKRDVCDLIATAIRSISPTNTDSRGEA